MSAGLPGAVPDAGAHDAVPAAERQGASVDSGERGACDLGSASGPGVRPAPPGLLSGGDRDPAALPQTRRGVHRPQEPQVRHEASVRDVGLKKLPKLTKDVFFFLKRGAFIPF